MCVPSRSSLPPFSFFRSSSASLSPRTSDGSPRGSWIRDAMIYAPCVHADLLMRAHRLPFLPRGKKPWLRTEKNSIWSREIRSVAGRDLIPNPTGNENRTCGVNRPFRADGNGWIWKKVGNAIEEWEGRKTFDRFPGSRIFIRGSMALIPSNRRARGHTFCLEACASCPTMAKPRRLFLSTLTRTRSFPFRRWPTADRRVLARANSRAQEAQSFRGDRFAPRQPRDPPRKFFFPRSANRQARCVRRYVISWQIERSTDRY